MWLPSTSAGKAVASRVEASPREPKSSRCRVLEITPAVPVQLEVGLQALGQPGATGPHAHQQGVGLEQALHAGHEVGVERLGIEEE